MTIVLVIVINIILNMFASISCPHKFRIVAFILAACRILVARPPFLIMPWIATNATTGMPSREQDRLFDEVSQDLTAALAHRLEADLDTIFHPCGVTLWFDFGKVTVTYTVVEAIGSQGSGCTWRVRYVSHGGKILWLKTNFVRGQCRHRVCDEFSVYPDQIGPKRRRRSQACSAELGNTTSSAAPVAHDAATHAAVAASVSKTCEDLPG